VNLRTFAIALLFFMLPGQAVGDDSDIEALVAELEQVKGRLAELEQLRQRVRTLEARLEEANRSVPSESATAEGMEKRDVASTSSAPEPEPPAIDIGGALRFTTFANGSVKGQRGKSGLDLFRLSADGSIDNILLSAEYRFYPFMDTIHHGWLGYKFDDESQLQAGITRVPFGILPYASHNFWFGVPYYLGLSDDYDLGVKYVRPNGPWDLQLAFFKNSELSNSADLGRYSYDVVSAGTARNEETNQFNARVAYTFGAGTTCSHEVGVSGQWSELYNLDTEKRGDMWAAATHLDTRCGRWNFQLEAARYDHNPVNPAGIGANRIELGAFESLYDIAPTGTVGIANIAYNFPLSGDILNQLTCYNDYSVLYKDGGGDDSILNTTGCAIGIGPLFIYADLINANNMVFFGNGSLAEGGEDDWDTRLNLNVGYYW